jgi:dipeptidyl aminopeptidase/acylaminoacyl peptidase
VNGAPGAPAAGGSGESTRTGGGPVVAPFGAWRSSLPISRLAEGVRHFAEPRALGGTRWWLEGRPEEGGRQLLVRLDPDGTLTRLTPEGFNARSRVQEYGGGALLVAPSGAEPLVVVADFSSGRLHRVAAPGRLEPLTPEGAARYADAALDGTRGRLIAVREDHEPETLARHGEAENSLVAIDLASGEVRPLAGGADFYAAPRVSPDGRRLAWLEWRHPNMPWDGTVLRVAAFADDGSLADIVTAAGDARTWVSQPAWSSAGDLVFVSEPGGWMNLHRWRDGRTEPLTDVEAEFAPPDWRLGNRSYGFLPDGALVAVGRSAGRDRIYRVGPEPGRIEEIPVPWTEMAGLAVDGWQVVLQAAAPDQPAALVELDTTTGTARILREAVAFSPEPGTVSIGRHVTFPTTGGREAHGIFYPPCNPAFSGPAGTLPPLIVTSHGGPTSAAFTGFTTTVQLFTSRGYAVLDVDYGGSTGYGRAYRERLVGQWGVVDVDDCVAGARWLTGQGLVDGARVAIRGGSASGYTTLCAITFREAFRAGTSMFGIGDLETFVRQTHKFESRYLDRLVGPYPAARDRYRERSPLNFPDRIRCPALILQGAEDRVVPPAQAEQIVASLREHHVPHAYVLFPGEDHGFRNATSIIRAFEAELSFYGQVFGITPADPNEPIEVQFLQRGQAPES